MGFKITRFLLIVVSLLLFRFGFRLAVNSLFVIPVIIPDGLSGLELTISLLIGFIYATAALLGFVGAVQVRYLATKLALSIAIFAVMVSVTTVSFIDCSSMDIAGGLPENGFLLLHCSNGFFLRHTMAVFASLLLLITVLWTTKKSNETETDKSIESM